MPCNMMNRIYQQLAIMGLKPKPTRDGFYGYLILKINDHRIEIKPTYGYTKARNEFFEDVDIFIDSKKYIYNKYSQFGDPEKGSWNAVEYACAAVKECASKFKEKDAVQPHLESAGICERLKKNLSKNGSNAYSKAREAMESILNTYYQVLLAEEADDISFVRCNSLANLHNGKIEVDLRIYTKNPDITISQIILFNFNFITDEKALNQALKKVHRA